MDSARVVVDTNIVFSALLSKEARSRETLLTDRAHDFFCPRFVMVELFKHKERIQSVTRLSEAEVLECLIELLSRISFIDEGSIPIGTWLEGRRLCADVDPKDTPFVTLSLHLGAILWTNDVALKSGLVAWRPHTPDCRVTVPRGQ